MLDYIAARLPLSLASILLLKNDRRGVTALEYGMIAALIAAVIVGVITTLGGHLNDAFTSVNNGITPKT